MVHHVCPGRSVNLSVIRTHIIPGDYPRGASDGSSACCPVLEPGQHHPRLGDVPQRDAALDAIDREFGGLDAYVEKALGIIDEKRDALRARYLTDDPRG